MKGDDNMFLFTYILIGITAWLAMNIVGAVLIIAKGARFDWKDFLRHSWSWLLGIVAWTVLWPILTVNYILYVSKII